MTAKAEKTIQTNTPVFNAIKTRRACRSYTDQSVSKIHIQKMLEAGRWAPSAGNRRIHKFIVVQKQKMLGHIRKLSPGMLGLPTALIIICTDVIKAR